MIFGSFEDYNWEKSAELWVEEKWWYLHVRYGIRIRRNGNNDFNENDDEDNVNAEDNDNPGSVDNADDADDDGDDDSYDGDDSVGNHVTTIAME